MQFSGWRTSLWGQGLYCVILDSPLVRYVDYDPVMFAQLARIDWWEPASTERLTEHPVQEQTLPRTLQCFF